jgi:hypothetical protein
MRSVKFQAFLDLALVAGTAVAAGVAFTVAVKLFGIAAVMIVGGAAGCAYCFYQLFRIRCEQIEMARKYRERN